MELKIALILSLAAFIVLMAAWIIRSEENPKKNRSYLDPNKPYNKAKELGLNLPKGYEDVLPGV